MWVRGSSEGDSQLLNAAADISHVVQIRCVPILPAAKAKKSEKSIWSILNKTSMNCWKRDPPHTFRPWKTYFPCFFSFFICLLLCGRHFKLPLCLPVIFSCLGIIPCKGADKQSSSCGDTWTATSTGWYTLRGCWWWVRECEDDVERGEASGEGGGLSRGLSVHRLPWHCLRLCSMNSRMSAKGKREWHWPQVSRSGSPFRGSPWATPSLGESWESSSGKTPDSGSAGWRGKKEICQILISDSEELINKCASALKEAHTDSYTATTYADVQK